MSAASLALVTVACSGDAISDDEQKATGAKKIRDCGVPNSTPVQIAGGSFAMGQENVYPAQEGPVRETTVTGFAIDPHEVTNAQFKAFIEKTGYRTLAERPVDPDLFGVPAEQIPPELLQPGSAVFVAPDRPSSNYNDWWRYVPGASWRKPYGPDGPDAMPNEPVVHLAYDDMEAYAEWAGGRIPTEAEWEYAANAGGEPYVDQPSEANTWQGVFPVFNKEADSFRDIAPIGCFAANANGLFDMIGNVWELTSDYYRPGHEPTDRNNPLGPDKAAVAPPGEVSPARVMKGGSYLCAPNYCQRYRPAARQPRDPSMGASNVGFRLVYDSPS